MIFRIKSLVARGLELKKINAQEKYLWLAERRTGITGSDAAAILGMSPYKTAGEVWLDKKGLLPPLEENAPMQWGNILEPIIADRYAKVMGVDVMPCGLTRHPKHNWMIANPDRLIKGIPRGLEVKTASEFQKKHWGETGSDIVPEHYLWQCYHYMTVFGYKEWHLAALLGGSDFRIYVIKFPDDTISNYIVEQEQAFYENYVMADKEPPPDAGRGVSEYIKKMYAKASQKAISAQTEEEKTMLLRLSLARESFDEAEVEDKAAENAVKLWMKDAVTAQSEELGIKIRWANNKDSKKINWEAMFEELTKGKSLDEKSALKQAFEETKPGPRVFRFNDASVMG